MVSLFFFALLLSILLMLSYEKVNFYRGIVSGLLLVSVLIGFSSEFLSIFHRLNFQGICVFWTIVNLTLILLLSKKKKTSIQNAFYKIQSNLAIIIRNPIGILLILFITLTFIQGLIYPPNNWDSLTYHMGRIPHWVENQSLENFPTAIYRQIYSPPLGELIITQLCILNSSDLFANAVQLIFLIGSLAAFIEISKEFGFSRRAILIGIVFLITMPELLLQASSTQNDIIVSFFILTSILFATRAYINNKLDSIIVLGLSIGLALYTKGTSYIYLLPIILFWLFLYIRKYKKFSLLLRSSIIPVMIILINSGFYYRNYSLSGDPLGKNEDHLFNEKFGIKQSFTGLTKNIGNHLGVYPLSKPTNQIIEKIHLIVGEKINDPATNFNGITFKLENWQHHEDNASNIFQLLLIITCTIIFLLKINKLPPISLLLFGLPIVEFLLFCILLKWQPWHTRLELPLFFMFAFFTAYILDLSIPNRKNSVLVLTSVLLFIYALIIIILNPTRPFISNNQTSKISITDSRFAKYCANYQGYENDYKIVRQYLKRYQGRIGLELGGDMWEYVLYHDVFSTNNKIAIPINIENRTKRLLVQNKNKAIQLHYIISYIDRPFYKWDNHKYKQIKRLKLFSIYSK